MERDFMGLSHVKQETHEEEPIVAAVVPLRSTPMHWLFSSKAPGAVPQPLSFRDESPKIGFDSLVSTGLVSLTTTEASDSEHKPYAAVQGGVGYMLTTYPAKHDVRRMVVAQTKAAVSHASVGVPLMNSTTATAHDGSIVGITDMRNPPKTSGGPAKLTIFYNGSVCVYDNIVPEKAQAIMSLAGASATVPSALDKFDTTQPYGALPHHSIPAKPVGVLRSSSKFVEPLKVPVSSTFLSSPGTVPQFRRKSLARFLEKRRERVMINASPYDVEKKSRPEYRYNLSTNSSDSSPAVPAIN